MSSEQLFPQLFGGRESSEGVKLRWQGYNKLWEEQERRMNVSDISFSMAIADSRIYDQDILASVNDNMLREVSGFVSRGAPDRYLLSFDQSKRLGLTSSCIRAVLIGFQLLSF